MALVPVSCGSSGAAQLGWVDTGGWIRVCTRCAHGCAHGRMCGCGCGCGYECRTVGANYGRGLHLWSHPCRPRVRAQDVLNHFRGSELQNYFTKILEDNIKAIIKIQYVDLIPKAVKGKVRARRFATSPRLAAPSPPCVSVTLKTYRVPSPSSSPSPSTSSPSLCALHPHILTSSHPHTLTPSHPHNLRSARFSRPRTSARRSTRPSISSTLSP